MAVDDTERIEPSTRAELRAWLEAHHAVSGGVWVVYPHKRARTTEPSYDDIVEEALCFGWIDSRPGRVDDSRTRLYLCPRKPGSGWAATNKERLERLTNAGLMHEAGLAVVARAHADGSWTLLDSSEAGIVPDDLAQAFDSYAGSADEFAQFPLGVRKQILQWIDQARRPATRAARVDETARLAQQGIRANQWKARDHA